MPFYEMYFPGEWGDDYSSADPALLRELSAALNVDLDPAHLYKLYDETKYREGDIYIFYSRNSKDVFLYFDLLKEETDQMAMIVLGARIFTKDMERIRKILMKLYLRSAPRSAWQEDYFNRALWKTANGEVQNNDRNVIHFG